LLGAAPGVRVTQYGGLGAFATVSLRGAPPGQVAVYLDGTPISSAAQGVVNLSDLPFAPIARVEVYRGSSPLALGGATPGGAINLVTWSAPGLTSLSVARGSYDTWSGHGSVGAARGPLAISLHGGYQGSAGNFTYFDNNATPFNAADDSTSTRVNNRLDAANALATLQWAMPGGWRAVGRQHWLRKRQGVPGVGTRPAIHPSLALDRALTQIEFAREASGGAPALSARGAWQNDRSRFRDTNGELRPGRSDRDDHIRSASGALEAEGRVPGGWIALESAVTARNESAELHDAADGLPDPPTSARTTRGAMVGASLGPPAGWLLLRAASRWDLVDDHLRVVKLGGAIAATSVAREIRSPQMGARLRPIPALELRANWSDASRVPDFGELFGDQGSVVGNPALLPEHGRNGDAGGRLELGRGAAWGGALELSHFASRAENLIVYLRNGPSTMRAANVSRAEIAGDELGLSARAPGGLSARAAMTWMDAVDRGIVKAWSGKRLPGRPERSGSLHVTLARRAFSLDGDLSYIGENFLDPYNRQRVPSRTLVGAALGLSPWSASLRLTVEGKNLGDQRAFDVGGYPLPGRSVFVALELRHGPAGHTQP